MTTFFYCFWVIKIALKLADFFKGRDIEAATAALDYCWIALAFYSIGRNA